MSRIIRTTAALAVLAGSLIISAPADAAPSCATRAEFKQVHNGQKPSKVRAIIGASGKVVSQGNSQGYRYLALSFKTCEPYKYGSVLVSFSAEPDQPLTVDGKSGVFV